MNFFAHQDHARRQTRRMLVMFALAVIAIVVAIDGVLVIAFGGDVNGGIGSTGLFAISLAIVSAIALGSLYRIASLRDGGSAVALQLGGRPVPADTTDFTYRRLRNVVEEIAIAAGVPVPDIFVLEDEAAINAFASGYAPTDAAVTVTRGALDKLTRAELQGVIGHEFSHILNGDMRLNIRLIGVVFGIVVIATVGRKVAQVAARGGKDSAVPALLGLVVFAVGYIGVIFARMIKASVSRQREFLADASAVQFTRQTEGIAGALKKIGGLSEGSRLASSDTEEVAHMLFGDGVGYSALFATHPPLMARIRKLDPAFREEDYHAIAAAWSQPTRVDDALRESEDLSIAGFAPAGARPRASTHSSSANRSSTLPDAVEPIRVSPAGVVRQVGNPGNDDRAAARTLHASIPDLLREAAAQPGRVMPLVFALLLSADAAERSRQLATIAQHFDGGTRALVETLAATIAGLHPIQRLPLAALTFPALRRRPRPQLTIFMSVLQALIDSDGRVSLDEYCLARLIGLQVMDALDPAAALVIGRVRLREVESELRDLLAIVAQHGHDNMRDAQRAYVLGLHEVLPAAPTQFMPPTDWTSALDRALPKLDRLAPAGKELVVGALTRAISADGVISVAEAELLRTVCAALHCPLPPLLQAAD